MDGPHDNHNAISYDACHLLAIQQKNPWCWMDGPADQFMASWWTKCLLDGSNIDIMDQFKIPGLCCSKWTGPLWCLWQDTSCLDYGHERSGLTVPTSKDWSIEPRCRVCAGSLAHSGRQDVLALESWACSSALLNNGANSSFLLFYLVSYAWDIYMMASNLFFPMKIPCKEAFKKPLNS